MNFLAGFLLLVSGGNESESFGMIVAMDKKYSVMSLYEEGFPMLMFLNFVFQREFGHALPAVQRRIDLLKAPDTMWVARWMHTLFLNSIPLHLACRFWDFLFSTKTLLPLVSLSLSLVHAFRKNLAVASLDDLSHFVESLRLCRVITGELKNSPAKSTSSASSLFLTPILHLMSSKPGLRTTDAGLVIDIDMILK